jgi:hypothetical protein
VRLSDQGLGRRSPPAHRARVDRVGLPHAGSRNAELTPATRSASADVRHSRAMAAIREPRIRASLTCAEVARAVGRSAEWLGLAEVGASHVLPEQERVILVAIARLERFQQTVAVAKEKLTADLKLPPAPPTRGRPHPGGSHAP